MFISRYQRFWQGRDILTFQITHILSNSGWHLSSNQSKAFSVSRICSCVWTLDRSSRDTGLEEDILISWWIWRQQMTFIPWCWSSHKESRGRCSRENAEWGGGWTAETLDPEHRRGRSCHPSHELDLSRAAGSPDRLGLWWGGSWAPCWGTHWCRQWWWSAFACWPAAPSCRRCPAGWLLQTW